jgi:hypothetical protein
MCFRDEDDNDDGCGWPFADHFKGGCALHLCCPFDPSPLVEAYVSFRKRTEPFRIPICSVA